MDGFISLPSNVANGWQVSRRVLVLVTKAMKLSKRLCPRLPNTDKQLVVVHTPGRLPLPVLGVDKCGKLRETVFVAHCCAVF